MKSQWGVETAFGPLETQERVEELKAGWSDAIKRTLSGK
jgi:hypothetical protein